MVRGFRFFGKINLIIIYNLKKKYFIYCLRCCENIIDCICNGDCMIINCII